MKNNSRLLLLFLLLTFYANSRAQKTYVLIQKKSGILNKAVAGSLPVSLKAMAALYSAMGGTNCLDMQCELTTALGLGKQGSEAQKNLIQKYFPEDKVAKLVIGQDCYLSPTTSSSFSNFKSLSFIVAGDIVQVNYELDVLNNGSVKKIKGPDIYQYQNKLFKNKKRVLYSWTEK